MQSVASLGIRPSSLTRWLGENVSIDMPVSVAYVRDGEQKTLPLDIQWRFRRLEVDPNAPEKATELRKSMLGF